MKKTLSIILAVVMLLSAFPMTVFADTQDDYDIMLLDGLADPTYSKNTENYDGYHFVYGTKAVWDCKLYTLSATATNVSGSIVTFDIAFYSKIPEPYTKVDGGWYGYNIHAVTNMDSWDFTPSQKMQITVDTSEKDPFGTSAAGGSQFIKIRIKKYERDILSSPSYSRYADSISAHRSVDYSGINLEDTYALSYYVRPDYTVNVSSFTVSKNSIALGTYAYESIVRYRVKGTSNWSEATFAKNSAMVLKGLKAGTSYEIHPLCKIYFSDLETGENKYNLDQVCDPFVLTTAISSKPKVTSIKVGKIKYGKKNIPGYWETHANQPSVWRKAQKLNTATYKITVKVKSVPKNAKGLYLNLGGQTYYAKGNKKTYTFKVTSYNKKSIKGKKVSGNFYWSSNTVGNYPLGLSPAKKASYKIKAGTYKIK